MLCSSVRREQLLDTLMQKKFNYKPIPLTRESKIQLNEEYFFHCLEYRCNKALFLGKYIKI